MTPTSARPSAAGHGSSAAAHRHGVHIDDPQRCDEQMAEALAMPGQVLIEAVVDPLEAALLAHISRDQAIKFAEALVRGEPRGLEIARTTIGAKIREMV